MNFEILIQIIDSWTILIVFLHLVMLKKFECICNKYISFLAIWGITIFTYYQLHLTEISLLSELYILAFLVLVLYNLFFKGKLFQISLKCIILLQLFLLSRIWMFIIYEALEGLAIKTSWLNYVIHVIDAMPFFSRNFIFIILASWLYIKLNSKYLNFDYLYENKKVLNICLIFGIINYNVLLSIFIKSMELVTTDRLVRGIINVSIISVIFLFYIVTLFRMISEKSYIHFLLKVLEGQLKIQFNHYNNLEYAMKKSRTIVHDTKHHILALDTLLANENVEEAKKYLENMKSDLFLLEKNTICQHKLIDAILQFNIGECAKKNIQFDYDVEIPEHISIDNFDLSIVFGNLLNNAVEACENMTDDSIDKHIKVVAHIINHNLVIKVKNTTTNTVNLKSKEMLKTTKKDVFNHGIGLLSIKNSVEKYNGNMSYHVVDNIFEIKLIMYANN